MSDTAFERVRAALESSGLVTRTTGKDKISAQCPAHDDRNPSLSVTGIATQALVYCHGGCHVEDVLGALGMGKADLFDTRRGADYRYNDGRTVHRTPDKKFRQSGNTKGTASLYRLDNVNAAVAAGETVFVVEGEKDVHALETLGVTATCSPMGAGKAGRCDWSPLKGGHVLIVADQDAPGRKHARDVQAILRGLDVRVAIVAPKVGKDAADHIAAGHSVSDFAAATEYPPPRDGEQGEWRSDGEWYPDHPGDEKGSEGTRRVRLTPASSIKPRPVHWTWNQRIPAGELALTPGRGGIGKSTFHAWLIAHLTRGTLPGTHYGRPKPCIIAATEDSWDRTIVPRLIVAGADLDATFRVDVTTETEDGMSISLPRDVDGLAEEINRIGAALLSVDPLLGVVHGGLDTHKDAEVRQALQPLVRLADSAGCTILGNAHFNKSSGSDPLSLVMGSAAFGNVARAVLGFARDTEAEDGSCVISQVKNNLGRVDLPSLRYVIEESILDTEEGPAGVGRLVMLGESERSVGDILRDRGDGGGDQDEIEEWLRALLCDAPVKSAEVYRSADAAGYSKDQAKRAKKKLGVVATHPDIKGPWFWELPPRERQGSQGSGLQETGSLAPLDAPLGGEPPRDEPPERECLGGCGRTDSEYFNPNTWLCSRCESEDAA